MVFGLILAGGTGSRMGNVGKPKQFLEIGGKPVILHTLERFAEYDGIDGIYVLCPSEWISYTVSLIESHTSEDVGMSGHLHMSDISRSNHFIRVISGGASRNETIMCGINAIEDEFGVDKETLIVTHDAARPFIDSRILSENIEVAKRDGAATTAVPATDTILWCKDGECVQEIPDRSLLYQCQTPQTFHAWQLRDAYEGLAEEEREKLTDASKIMLLKGYKVSLVMGDIKNIKLTYPSDILVAESFLAQR